jgi:CBS domain-containing protein
MRFMRVDRCSTHAALPRRTAPPPCGPSRGRRAHAPSAPTDRSTNVRARAGPPRYRRRTRLARPDPQSFQGGMDVAQQIQDIMTKQVHTVRTDASVLEVARIMRDRRIGDVLVTDEDGSLCGIITDRDIVVRAVAAGMSLDQTKVSEICTEDLVQVDANASIEEIIAIMREHAIRRVPVVHGDKPIGIVSIGDLARARDPNSALADISAAAPNN